jgi:hypothetical protein
MVPLVGMQAGGSALPITARGALLDSSAALSLVTDRDFLALQVSIPREHKVFQMACGTHHSSIWGTQCSAVDTEEKGKPCLACEVAQTDVLHQVKEASCCDISQYVVCSPYLECRTWGRAVPSTS